MSLQTRAQSPGGIADIDVAAAPDGGGVAVWRSRDGKIHAIRFGPTGPIGGGNDGEEPGDCVDEVTVGVAVVLAKDGCLKRVGDKYTAPGDIRVNGVDLDASGAERDRQGRSDPRLERRGDRARRQHRARQEEAELEAAGDEGPDRGSGG